jgi:hypothetical protein
MTLPPQLCTSWNASEQGFFSHPKWVGPNAIRAERSEQETDSDVSCFQSTTPLLTKVKSVSAFSIARVL